jgi:RimJ/RimL family protein N-acetyltransferase
MEILMLNILDEKQKAEVRELVQECLKSDGLERSLYLSNDNNYYNDLKCFSLLYKNNKLVSILSIEQPNELEAEISAYTLPLERKKGYFRLLLKKAMEELESFQINKVFIVVESLSKDGLQTMEHIGTNYTKSEYLLYFDIDTFYGSNTSFNLYDNGSIKIENTKKSELKNIAKHCTKIFNSTLDDEYELLSYVNESSDCFSLSIFKEKRFIGICNISFNQESAFIFGFGILPNYQGMGYGKQSLTMITKILKDKGLKKISLHVGSDNRKAYSLYKNFGFQISTQYDYYSLDER